LGDIERCCDAGLEEDAIETPVVASPGGWFVLGLSGVLTSPGWEKEEDGGNFLTVGVCLTTG